MRRDLPRRSIITGPPNGPVLFCAQVSVVCRRRLSASVTVPVGRPRRRSGGRHCTAGKYGYVPLGRHLVLDMTEKLEVKLTNIIFHIIVTDTGEPHPPSNRAIDNSVIPGLIDHSYKEMVEAGLNFSGNARELSSTF